MVSGHAGGSGGGHAAGRYRRRLAVSFGLIAVFFVVELIFGLVSGSLALVSDAGHMAADVVALGAALVATRIATRPDPTGRRTYGSYRAEVLASLLAVLLMYGVSVYVVIEAVRRLGRETEVSSGPMLVVGALGLVVNLVSLVLLRSGARESLNVKGAYLEVVSDTAGSVGVIIAGWLVAATGRAVWDSAVGLAIGVFVAVRATILAREVFAVLAQHAPTGLDPAAVAGDLAALEDVSDVHDLHLWTLTSGMNVATAHLVVAESSQAHGVLDRAVGLLRERYGIEHATLQVEPAGHTGCEQTDW